VCTFIPLRHLFIIRRVDAEDEYIQMTACAVVVIEVLKLRTASSAAANGSGTISHIRRGMRHLKL
jgi:hypothetical protein